MQYTANGDFLKNRETFTNIKRAKENFEEIYSSQNTGVVAIDDPRRAMGIDDPLRRGVTGRSIDVPVVIVDPRKDMGMEDKNIVDPLPGNLNEYRTPPLSSTVVPNNQIESNFTQGGVTYIVGKQGPKGDQGNVGPVGPKGDQGPKGDEGNVGPTGPKGEQGPAGMKGDQGPVGPVGQIGPSGPTGPSGPKGDPGNPGADGKDFDPTPYKRDICTFFNSLANADIIKNSDISPPGFCLNMPMNMNMNYASNPAINNNQQPESSRIQQFTNTYRENFNNVKNSNNNYFPY